MRGLRVRDEQGVAVVVAIIVLLVCLLLATAVVSATVDTSTGSRRDTVEKRAFEAAEAGLQQTLYRLNMLLNTQPGDPSGLNGDCIGSGASVQPNGSFTYSSGEQFQSTSNYAGIVCAPDTESLGNGAFYTSWVSTAATNQNLTCAGTTIAASALIGERCITSQGVICPASYTSVTQLPCPNPVVHRVEERISANVGKPDFPAGAVGLDGILVQNSGRLLGTSGTNGQLDVVNTGFVQGPAEIAPGAPYPLIGSPNALIGSCGQSYSGTSNWPSPCVVRATQAFTLPKPNFGSVYCGTTTNGTWTTTTSGCPISANVSDNNHGYDYTQPWGDWLIANAFLPCANAVPACPHDTFSGATCSVAPNAGVSPLSYCWDPYWRTLNLPNKEIWTLTGSQYNLCGLELSGQAGMVMAPNLRTAIFIDSDNDTRSDGSAPACDTNSGYVNLGNQSTLVNNTINPATGLADSSALQFYVYGMKTVSSTPTYNNNDCTAPGAGGPTSPCVVFGQKGNFSGTIFAANSDVLVANSGNDYGAVSARTLVYSNTGTFTMDPNDQSITTDSLSIYFRTAWSDCTAQLTSATNPMAGC